jgi:DNA polymerase-3 subunit gamma/tau
MTFLRMLAFRPASASAAPAATGAAPKTDHAAGGEKRAVAETRPAPRSAPPARAAAAPAAGGWKDPDWSELIGTLPLKGAIRMLAINCAYLGREGDTLKFSADSKAEPVLNRERQTALASVLSDHFGETLRVSIELEAGVSAGELETPVQAESRKTDERLAAARAALESDPNVKAMKSMFGAELKPDSIEPINRSRSD